jgi:PKD repeat protein
MNNKGKLLPIVLGLMILILIPSMALACTPTTSAGTPTTSAGTPTTSAGTSSLPGIGDTSSLPGIGDTSSLPGIGDTSSLPGIGDSTPVTAAFVAKQINNAAPFNVSFTDKSTGPVTYWNWDFGDGNTSTDQNASHLYAVAGKYNVTLTVADEMGAMTNGMMGSANSTTKIITVAVSKSAATTSAKAPGAAFSTCISGRTVKFTDKSTGSPTCWSWNFGDKSTSTSKNPTHKYSKAGKYKVILTAKNAKGSNQKTSYVTVK